MSRKRIHKTAGDRVKAHIERRGGRRVSVVLDQKAKESLDWMVVNYGMTIKEAVNASIVNGAAELKRSK